MPLTPLRLHRNTQFLVSLMCQGKSACLPGWSSAVLLQPHPTGPLEVSFHRVPEPSHPVTTPPFTPTQSDLLPQ